MDVVLLPPVSHWVESWSLQAKGDFQRTYTYTHLLELLLQCSCPYGRPLSTHASAGDPQTPTGRSGSVSYGVTGPFPWVLVCTFIVTSKSLLFPHPVEIL